MKKCLTCGGALIKRAHESKRRFEKKQFCSAACSRSYMKEHKMGWWSPENREERIIELPSDKEEYVF